MSLAVLLLRYSTHLVSPTARRLNILLITIDTLRWDHLGCYGNTRAATPVLDALASRGVRFETAVAHVPLTAPSHASILTGLTPVRHGVRDNGGYALPHGVPTLASRLRASGYRTGAFVSGFPLDRRFGLGAGFDAYDDRLTRTAGRAPYTERRADVTTDHAISWLDRQEPAPNGGGISVGPWFIWVHYFDPHAPYVPPHPFAGRFADRPYDGEVAFVDSQIGRLLQHLDTRGEVMRTLVLVTADHGESFGEHGEDTHGVFVYDATLRVPFIIAGPGANTGQASSVLARSIDVVPTLLDLGGLGVPRDVDGRSLRQAIDGGSLADEPAYIESLMAARHLGWSPLQGFRSASWKYIRAPRSELYDLRRDPGERQNRIADHRAQAASFESLLRAHTPSAGASAAATSTGPGADAQLRALGYLSGGVSTTRVSPERDPKDGIRLISTLERGVAEVAMNPAHAVDILETVLREDPSVTLARRHLALAHIALGQHAAAIQQLVWLRREGQATPDDLLALSESKRALGKDAEARALVQEAARLDPRSPEPALTEARAEMAAARVGEAEKAYRRALDIAGEHPEALRGLGEVAMIRGDLETARRFFERAHARDPDDPVATVRLAVVRARAGEIGAALPLFQRAVQQRPDDPDALAGLGAVLARSGRPAEAVPYFERAIGTGLRTPAVFNGLGFAKLETGDGAGALMALQTSLQLRPDQPQVADAVRRLSQPDTDGARR